jgi:hypothetical protein
MRDQVLITSDTRAAFWRSKQDHLAAVELGEAEFGH